MYLKWYLDVSQVWRRRERNTCWGILLNSILLGLNNIQVVSHSKNTAVASITTLFYSLFSLSGIYS